MRELERVVLLKNDGYQVDGPYRCDDRAAAGIGLRAYGQHDPVVEYKREGFDMFDAMIDAIREDTVRMIFSAQVRTREEPKREQVARRRAPPARPTARQARAQARGQKIGLNDPCPCGSGKSTKVLLPQGG